MGAFKAVFYWGLLSLLLLFHSSGAKVVTVDVLAVRNLLNQGHFFLDVRTEEEFRSGHLENAANIPYMLSTPQGMVKNPKFTDQVLTLFGKEDRLVVGCRSGIRSLNACTDLREAEFKNVYNMEGGYIGWTENGFAVTEPHTQEL